MTFPSNVKLHMALAAHPHYCTFTHLTTEVRRLFNKPTRLRRYSDVDGSIVVPLDSLLTKTEMDKILSAIGKAACGNDSENSVLFDMVRFLCAEIGLSTGVLLTGPENDSEVLAFTDGEYSSYRADMGAVMSHLADGHVLTLKFGIGPRPEAYK